MDANMEHVKELLSTHAEYMNRRMDETRNAVLDMTHMVADHETRLTVIEKRPRQPRSKWVTMASAVGGFLSGLFSSKLGG